MGPTRNEPNSAIRKLWFSSILVILTEITETAPLSKPRGSFGMLTTAIKAWTGQALCAYSGNEEFTKLHLLRFSFWIRSAVVKEYFLPRKSLQILMYFWTVISCDSLNSFSPDANNQSILLRSGLNIWEQSISITRTSLSCKNHVQELRWSTSVYPAKSVF